MLGAMSAAQLSAKGEALKMIAPVARIESRMFFTREHCERVELKAPGTRRRPPCGEKVILTQHLAELYGVEPRALNQAVKRNIARLPEDFMLQLNREEFANSKSQFVTSSRGTSLSAPVYFK